MTAGLRPPPRAPDGHKGTFGTVVVAGGETAMPGAPAFAARAALRAGCGSVRIAAPARLLAAVLALEPSAIGATPSAEAAADAVIVGCGWGAAGHGNDLRARWRQTAPLVVDGGGLRALARGWQRLGPRTGLTVLTPHPGEYAGIARALGLPAAPTSPAERRTAARKLALATGTVVVLKGHGTVISDGRRTAQDGTGGPVLAIPGSGDVLSGIIGSFLAQGMDAWSAARLGVAVHAAAGNRWRAQHGDRGLRASELADLVPHVLNGSARRSRRRSPPGAALP